MIAQLYKFNKTHLIIHLKMWIFRHVIDISITLFKETSKGGVQAYMGTRGIWEISVSSLKFCCDPKKIVLTKEKT